MPSKLRTLIATAAAAGVCLLGAASAEARVFIGVGFPGYYGPPPAPIYYAPRVDYYPPAPPPVYERPVVVERRVWVERPVLVQRQVFYERRRVAHYRRVQHRRIVHRTCSCAS